MLNPLDIYEFRTLRGLSYREVANYCNVSHTLISDIEKGNKGLTKETHDEIVMGINLAYKAKVDGTLQAKNTKKPKEEKVINQEVIIEKKPITEKKNVLRKGN